MIQNSDFNCISEKSTLIGFSIPARPVFRRITDKIFSLLLGVTRKIKKILKKHILKNGTSKSVQVVLENISNKGTLNLQPDDWIEILSIEEISLTLDKHNKYKGLLFMSEMKKFCGKKYQVFKRIEKIRLESTGEYRKIKQPTYLLAGVYCDGADHEGCDRTCFHLWREVWIKKIEVNQ